MRIYTLSLILAGLLFGTNKSNCFAQETADYNAPNLYFEKAHTAWNQKKYGESWANLLKTHSLSPNDEITIKMLENIEKTVPDLHFDSWTSRNTLKIAVLFFLLVWFIAVNWGAKSYPILFSSIGIALISVALVLGLGAFDMRPSVASQSTMLRSGPGPHFPKIQTLSPGEIVWVKKEDPSKSWYQVSLADGSTYWSPKESLLLLDP